MISKKYTAQYNNKLVEEYIKRCGNNPKLSKAEFAYEKNVPDSTFNDWVLKYKRMGNGFCNITSEIKKLDSIEVVDVTPVETYTVTEIQNENAPLSVNKVRMQYNGAIIDFDESLLERVLEVLRTW